MDQTARPVIIAAGIMLAVGLVTAGLKAGGGGTPQVVGDGPTASGAPDATGDPTQAAPQESASPTPSDSPTVSESPTASESDATPAPSESATDGSAVGGSGTAGPDLDDMPNTGGGLAVALGGVVAASAGLGLRRRR